MWSNIISSVLHNSSLIIAQETMTYKLKLDNNKRSSTMVLFHSVRLAVNFYSNPKKVWRQTEKKQGMIFKKNL